MSGCRAVSCRWRRSIVETDPEASEYCFIPGSRLELPTGESLRPARFVGVLRAYRERPLCLVIADRLGDYTDEERAKALVFFYETDPNTKECPCLKD